MSVIFNNLFYGSFTYRAGYVLTLGTKAPVFGTGPGTYPPTSWTGLQNVSADDAYIGPVLLPFTFYHSGVGYNSVYIGSNSYLTYGAGSNNYSGLSSSNPALPKYFLGSADNSYQRVSYYSFNADYFRIRYEGTSGTSGTVGNPNIVYEVTHFNPNKTNGNNVIEVLVGKHGRTTGLFGSANTTNYWASGTIAANQSYVFVGSATGNNHTIYSGYYMSGTDY